MKLTKHKEENFDEEFLKIAIKVMDANVLSHFEQKFCELYTRACLERRKKLFKALPETIERITKSSEFIENELDKTRN